MCMCKQSRKAKAFLCVYTWTCFFPWGWMPPHSAYLPVLLFQDYVMTEKYNSPNRKVKGQAECCCTQKKHISDDVIASRYMDIIHAGDRIYSPWKLSDSSDPSLVVFLELPHLVLRNVKPGISSCFSTWISPGIALMLLSLQGAFRVTVS